MADSARVKTDKQLKELEKEIERVYKRAEKEITEKWYDYMEQADKKLKDLHDEYVNAPTGEKRAAKRRYEEAAKRVTLQDNQFKQMRDNVVSKITDANNIAVDYTNGALPPIYTTNYNYIDPDLYKTGVRFDLADEATVRRMIKDGDIKLPKKKISISKDKAWNTKKLNSEILQGILQGESMKDIADRIFHIVDNNEKAAIRNARTLVTGAESRGRIDRYHDLQDEGVVMTKVWMATNDDRTRDWHADMDGQEVGIDEMFVDGLGNELEYPADPNAEPETVYNCRCSMRSHIIGIRQSDGTIAYI